MRIHSRKCIAKLLPRGYYVWMLRLGALQPRRPETARTPDRTMWTHAFQEATPYQLEQKPQRCPEPLHIPGLKELRTHLDYVHIKHCLLRPYFEVERYPLVEPRELLPSFEVDLYEYKELPGFSQVVFDRPLSPLQEIFQFDMLHPLANWHGEALDGDACQLEDPTLRANLDILRSRLPKVLHETLVRDFEGADVCSLENYAALTPYLTQLERAHVLARDTSGDFCLSGVYGSLPSDLDTELKRFGIKIGKFSPGDNARYERNRLFVYQFLMELYGFGIVSERRTSAALFARRLRKLGERFLVRVLGQSDRTITTLAGYEPGGSPYPLVDKTALVQVDDAKGETCQKLKEQGFFVDVKNRVVILRVVYQQHKFNPKNVREDRALSVLRQEIIHPLTGRVSTDFNIMGDASSMALSLNDIVRGEHRGRITYKRNEVIQDTRAHEDRLKFLYSWLIKHQRRIIGYSDEFYSKIVQVLESYLMAPENYEIFNEMNDLYQDVWSRYSYIQQARKIKSLEDLRQRRHKGEQVNYKEMLELMTDILGDLKFEIVNYFDSLVENALAIGDDVLADGYLRRTYVDTKESELTDYGREIRRLYGRLVSLLDEFRSIRRTRLDGAPPDPMLFFY